jgi:2-methylcitrate dehydratase PrpD
VKTRRGTETQDPDYPKGHPKRTEQDALKDSKNLAGESPNDTTK